MQASSFCGSHGEPKFAEGAHARWLASPEVHSVVLHVVVTSDDSHALVAIASAATQTLAIMRMTARLVASLFVLYACSSDDKPAIDGGTDATASDVATETNATDASSDAGVEAGCEKQACLDTAQGCAMNCDDQYNTCEGNCTTPKCMTGCKDAEATCLSGCLTTCKTCAADAACALPLCADASVP